ncbi:MAG: acyltransferase family protein, partial [Aquihabitans sp.]
PLFLVVGLVTALLLQRLLRRVGLRAWPAAVGAIGWTASPSAVLLETYLLYTPFEIVGLLATLVLVARWADRHRPLDAVALACVVSALALTRASFHLVWILGLFTALAALRWPWRRQLLWSSLIPLVLVGGLYAKNALVFGQFGPSSWMGNNLSRVTVEQLPPAERRELAGDGRLSPFAPYAAFSSLGEMSSPTLGATGPRTDARVLRRRHRVGTPFANTRARGYLEVSRARLHDSVWVVRHRPGAYARGIGRSTSVTFGASSDYFGYGPNVDRIEGAVTLERWSLGGWSPLPEPDDPTLGRWSSGAHEWLVLAAYLVVLIGVPWLGLRRRRARGTRCGPPATSTVVAVVGWGSVAYLTALGIFAEFGENNRFRSVTDPVVLVLLAWMWVTVRTGRPASPNAEAVDRAATSMPEPSNRQGALDGLRALFVAGVLAHHLVWVAPGYAGNWGRGGWTGVDGFFVLSGFLIGRILLRELHRTGTIRYPRFIARRFLRLYPPLAVVLAAMVAVSVRSDHTPWATLWPTVRASGLYAMNWPFGHRQPLAIEYTHLWSLAVEFQFYLLLPIVLWALARTRLPRSAWAAVLGAVIAASWVQRVHLWQGPASFPTAYVSLGSRVDALTWGVLLALAIHAGWLATRHVRLLRAAVVPSTAWAAWAAWHLDSRQDLTYTWGLTANAVAWAVVVAWVVLDPGTRVARALRWPGLTWLGTRSYSVYLIHYPAFFFATRHLPALTDRQRVAVALAIVAILAELSYRLLERPAMALNDRLTVHRSPAFSPEVTSG